MLLRVHEYISNVGVSFKEGSGDLDQVAKTRRLLDFVFLLSGLHLIL